MSFATVKEYGDAGLATNALWLRMSAGCPDMMSPGIHIKDSYDYERVFFVNDANDGSAVKFTWATGIYNVDDNIINGQLFGTNDYATWEPDNNDSVLLPQRISRQYLGDALREAEKVTQTAAAAATASNDGLPFFRGAQKLFEAVNVLSEDAAVRSLRGALLRAGMHLLFEDPEAEQLKMRELKDCGFTEDTSGADSRNLIAALLKHFMEGGSGKPAYDITSADQIPLQFMKDLYTRVSDIIASHLRGAEAFVSGVLAGMNIVCDLTQGAQVQLVACRTSADAAKKLQDTMQAKFKQPQ